MIKKYNYVCKFLSKAEAPYGHLNYSAVGEGSLKEMRDSFKSFLSKWGYTSKGINRGDILKGGKKIGSFNFGSTTLM